MSLPISPEVLVVGGGVAWRRPPSSLRVPVSQGAPPWVGWPATPQAVLCAGHGAEFAMALLEGADRPSSRALLAPERYFTGRGREVASGCEEINEAEFRRRELDAPDAMGPFLVELHPATPEQQPSGTSE